MYLTRDAMKRFLLSGLILALPCIATAQESRIELLNHYSTLLGAQKNFNIFLPAGYDQDTARYPVVYLFRGHEREWANPSEDASRRGNIKTVADRVSMAGLIGNMILVMPGLSAPPTPAEFDYVATELIPYVDSHFRTIPVRQKRGMDGFSYGGYDMLEMLWRYPELFFTAGAYDGSFWVVNLNLFFAGATDSYWNLLRVMKFMIHSTPAGNYASNLQFLSILGSHGITNAFDTLDLAPSSAHNWYFADLHMERALPLHWQHFLAGSQALTVQLHSPFAATTVSGTVTVQWSVQPHASGVRTAVDVSRNRGASWQELYSSTSTDTSFLWDTTPFQDGTGYMARVRVLGDSAYGYVQTGGRFTVNNPGNAIPEAGILFPDSAANLTSTQTIQWWAEDADGDSLRIAIDASTDGGITWSQIAQPPNSGVYVWETGASPNSSTYRVSVRASDAVITGIGISPPFAVKNPRQSLQRTLVNHISGNADGSVVVHVVDSSQVSGHTYRILFHDSLAGEKRYSVLDVNSGTTAVSGASVGTPDREGPAFDGLRLVLTDIDAPRFSPDSTRWITGVSNLIPAVTLPSFDPGTGLVTGFPYVSDYLIQIADHVVDTSSSLFNWSLAPMMFTVWNITESHQVDVLFTDLNGDGAIGAYDELILLERDSLGELFPTWALFFAPPSSPVFPSPGDVFLFKILKPFTSGDIYEFLALPTGIVSVGPSTNPGAFRLEQNYPNPFNPVTTIRYSIGQNGPVRLVVYDILGRQVAVLVNGQKAPGRYEVTFNAAGLASGMYLYRLTAGSFVQTRTMLLIR